MKSVQYFYNRYNLFFIFFIFILSQLLSITYAEEIQSVPINLKDISGDIKIHPAIYDPIKNVHILNIEQSSLKGIIEGNNFNIGPNGTVNFNHTWGDGSSTLVRVINSVNPTIISGTLDSPHGQIYLINPNGIIFGSGASVNVNGIVASSLNISNDLFNKGIASIINGSAAFEGGEGDVIVKQGATINATNGGKVMLFGNNITNSGHIKADGGQIIFAAGDKIYLANSDDPNLRGLLVEVDNGGVLENQISGKIETQTANITLAGIVVNQNGMVKATSSVALNGSVRIQAQDHTVTSLKNNRAVRESTVAGPIVFGKSSETLVIPDFADKSTVYRSAEIQISFIDIMGSSIRFMENSVLVVPGGNVSISAALNPFDTSIQSESLVVENTSRIYFDNASVVDVSGVGSGSELISRYGGSEAHLNVSKNIVSAELRGSELRDSPLQRNGILYTSTVFVDSRKVWLDGSVGTTIADVSGYTSQIGQTISEGLAAGGSIKIQSEGDVIFNPGATLNVSGGRVIYDSGIISSTTLISSNGKSYDISLAPKELNYVAILNRTHFEEGYYEGKDAGTVSISAPGMLLSGNLKGTSFSGAHQRTLESSPKGGSLQLGQLSTIEAGIVLPLKNTNLLHSDIIFNSSTSEPAKLDFESFLSKDQKQTLYLGGNIYAPTGFSDLVFYTDGHVSINNGSNLKTLPGGSIFIYGGGINLLGNLTSHGGTVSLRSKEMPGYVGFRSNQYSNNLSNTIDINGQIDVSGIWTNDLLMPSTFTTIVNDAGNVDIQASVSSSVYGGDIKLNPGSRINASGGAWVASTGKISSGQGGQITLKSGLGTPDFNEHIGNLVLNGTIRADSLSMGGQLNLTSSSILISQWKASEIGKTQISQDFFQQGGFTSYNITSYETLNIQDQVKIAPVSLTRILNRDYLLKATGSNLDTFSNLQLLPYFGGSLPRNSVSLSLNATTETYGVINLGEGSQIILDPRSKLQINANRQIGILGSLIVPGGEISIKLGSNPTSTEIVNYRDDQAIWLGSNSILNVNGFANVYTDNDGLLRGSIDNAGKISLDALKGSIVAQTGSSLFLDGVEAKANLNSKYATYLANLASNGGDLLISARESIIVDANISAQGGNSSALGGSFTIDFTKYLDGSINNLISVKYPTTPREVIVQNIGSERELTFNGSINSSLNGFAYISAQKLNNAGLDIVKITSRDKVRFVEDVMLSTRGEITLNSPMVIVNRGISAELNASYISIGNDQIYSQDGNYSDNTASNTGSINIKAQRIDLFGNHSIFAADGVKFNAIDDIQLHGILKTKSDLKPVGSLLTNGNILFNAARIFPSTLSNYTIQSEGFGSTISFSADNWNSGLLLKDPGVPFSVMSVLNVKASNIVQGGVLRAPFGEINLNAINQLKLAAGSLTSVSAENKTLPFGTITNGKSWNFDFGDRSVEFATLPNKTINLNGNVVIVESSSNDGLVTPKPKANIDLSGGGDLMAWEFTTGTGGSEDVLGGDGVFAVLPGLNSGYMAGNSQSYSNNQIKPGNMVYLSGGNGLAAGNYILLPAHYSLLAGAYSVKSISGAEDMIAQQNIRYADGSMLVSGYKMQYGGLVADARTSAFLVASGVIARTQSEFTTTLASGFFRAAYSDANLTGYRLPDDAGQLAISAVSNLVINGNMQMLAANSGRGAEVDISGAKIVVSGTIGVPEIPIYDKEGKIIGYFYDDYLKLSSSMLNAIRAESLLIGGKRSIVGSGTQLDVMASNVDLVGNANLTGQELILAAAHKVATAPGTSVSGNGSASTNSGALIVGSISTAGSGDGAVLRVSSGVQRELNRVSVAKSRGTLDLQGDITNAKSVILDATNTNTLSGSVGMVSGGSLSIGAPKISFGETTKADGLLLNSSRLSALGSPSILLFNSYSTLDFYGAVTMGDASSDKLSMRSSGINGYDNAGNRVTLTAKTVDFGNAGALSFISSGSLGTGKIVVNAKEIISGSNTFKTAGFSEVTLNADQFKGQGIGELSVTGNLNVNAKRITAASLSNSKITATGTLRTTLQPEFPTGLNFIGDDPFELAAALGGKLNVVANSISHAGNIEMPVGDVTLQAIGTGDSLTLQDGSTISAKGSAQMLGTVAGLVDGGRVSLLTTNGNIGMGSTAVIDVSATGGAAAGSLLVSSTGTANLHGELKGGAETANGVAKPTQGRFEYYASKFLNVDVFNNLNTILEKGKFNESRNIRVTQDDLTLASTVTAHNFTLTTDNGNISIAESVQINASGAKGGIVNFNAGQKDGSGKGSINLASGATINASATAAATESAGSTGDGGRVILSASTDSNISPTVGSSKITLASDSVINLSGKGLGSDGKLVLRAPRTNIANSGDSGAGANLTASISSENVKGDNATILIEGVKVYDKTGDLSLDTAYASTLNTNNTSFLTYTSTIKAALSSTFDARILVTAGDEIRSTGSVTIANDMNLQTWAPAPGALTIRAANNINVISSISAGFSTATSSGTLTSGGNWTYRMTAGANLQSADVQTTNNILNGNFTLAAGKIIRTGTGDIEIATGGNFILGSAKSVIYTAGTIDDRDFSKLVFNNSLELSENPQYGHSGGDISIQSKGNITGFYNSQMPANWLFRQGKIDQSNNSYNVNTSWWSSFGNFEQNIGTLSGGDISISASGTIRNLSAMISTNGRIFGSTVAQANTIINGGGDLKIRAGSNLFGGMLMVDKGLASVRVGGSLSPDVSGYSTAVALGDAMVDIQTLRGLSLMTVFNPMMTGLSPKNYREGTALNNINYFSTYGPNTSVTLSSIAANVNITNSVNKLLSPISNLILTEEDSLNIYPSNLKVSSVSANITIAGRLALSPSSRSNLQLGANININIPNNSYIIMSDIDAAIFPTPITVTNNLDFTATIVNSYSYGLDYHAPKPLHKGDTNPVEIFAGGDILGFPNSTSLILPKFANIVAGRDIKDLSVIGQNIENTNVSNISAGRDIIYTETKSSNSYLNNSSGIEWGGGGYLNISSGRNISLANAKGIVTRGNLINPYLSEKGANLSLLVGFARSDITEFSARYLDQDKTFYLSELRSFVKAQVNFIETNDKKDLTETEVWTQFNSLDESLKYEFIKAVFFNELRMAGKEHNDSESPGYGNYKRGYDAIASMFSGQVYEGKLDVSFSQIKTERGGDLNLMIPGGSAIIGLPKTPPGIIASKDDVLTPYDDSPSTLGFFTVKGGSINIFSRDNVDVAQSRVFTVGGGDILIWSTLGDIDAGKGAKTASSAPPPLVRTDINGVTVIDLAGVVTGSGIGTLQSLGTTSIGNVYLIAPSGTVDAGDAGVRSSGNLVVAAQAVANGANMQAGGTTSGVPAASTANVSFIAPVSADSSNSAKQAEKATEAASKSASKTASALPSLITVEVLALGDEAASSSDSEKDEKKKVKKQ